MRPRRGCCGRSYGQGMTVMYNDKAEDAGEGSADTEKMGIIEKYSPEGRL